MDTSKSIICNLHCLHYIALVPGTKYNYGNSVLVPNNTHKEKQNTFRKSQCFLSNFMCQFEEQKMRNLKEDFNTERRLQIGNDLR